MRREAADGIHALIELADADGKQTLGAGILAIHPPGVTRRAGAQGEVDPAITASSVTVERAPFTVDMTTQGRLIGSLTGEAVVSWHAV